MASVIKQGKKWTVRYRVNGRQSRHTLPDKASRRDAERLAREIQHAIDTLGHWEPAGNSPVDLDGLIRVYKASREAEGAQPSTLRLYRVLDRFAAHVRGRASVAGVDRLNRQAISDFLSEQRRQGNKENSLAGYAKVLAAFWRWAHEEHPAHVPIPRMPRIKSSPPPVVIAPSWEEIDQMLALLSGPLKGRNHQPTAVRRSLLIQRYTGLRVSQAAGLRWSDFERDLESEGPAIRIGSRIAKTRAEAAMNRWVPLHSHLHGLFASWRLADGRPGPEAPIVGQGMPRDPHDTVNRAWMLAGVCSDKWAGHPTHAIRKRYISHLVEAGITDAAIDHAVGHSPRGVRARHYVDPLAFFRLLREALHTIPAGDTKAA